MAVIYWRIYRAFTRSSKRPALTRVFWIHLPEVCWTFAGSCKHPIRLLWSTQVRKTIFKLDLQQRVREFQRRHDVNKQSTDAKPPCSSSTFVAVRYGLLDVWSIGNKSTTINSIIDGRQLDVLLITESWHWHLSWCLRSTSLSAALLHSRRRTAHKRETVSIRRSLRMLHCLLDNLPAKDSDVCTWIRISAAVISFVIWLREQNPVYCYRSCYWTASCTASKWCLDHVTM